MSVRLEGHIIGKPSRLYAQWATDVTLTQYIAHALTVTSSIFIFPCSHKSKNLLKTRRLLEIVRGVCLYGEKLTGKTGGFSSPSPPVLMPLSVVLLIIFHTHIHIYQCCIFLPVIFHRMFQHASISCEKSNLLLNTTCVQ